MFTEYSLWFIPLIVLIATALSYFSVVKGIRDFEEFSLTKKILLFALRFLGIFLILFLLLSPVKRVKHKKIEKPTVVLLQDNSMSLSAVKDARFYTTEYANNLDKLCKNLSKDYNVVRMLFGSETTLLKDEDKYQSALTLNDFATDIGQSLDYIGENYSSENLSAVVLCSDAIATQGDNFLNRADNFLCPLYTVAMGDTTVRKDVFITDIQYNKLAFVGSDYPIELTVKANKASGEKTALFMTKDGKTTKIKDIVIDDNDYSVTAELKTSSTKAGVEKISFHVGEINRESNKANNRKDIFIEVIDSKKNVLILADSPHPDISCLKTILEGNDNYTVSVNLQPNNLSEADKYDLVILHGLPDNTMSYNTVKNLRDKGVNLLFVVSQSTDAKLFNSLNTGINISQLSNATNQSTGLYNGAFSLFTLSEDITDVIKKMPPLLTKAAKYDIKGEVQTLLYQRIGAVSTSYPLIAFASDGLNKQGFILGENLWRWKLQNFLLNGDSSVQTETLVTKIVQYLANKTDKKRFRTEHKDIYRQNENVIFTAQFYNENFELVNTPEVTLQITDGKNNSAYTFGKNNNAYYLNLGSLPQGQYSFTAKTTYGGKEYKQSGRFAVSADNPELENLVAKHSDLYTLAAKTNAKMFQCENVLEVEKEIKKNENIKPVIHVSQENRKFISLWWYWTLIIATLGTEWFLRKYWGRL